MTDARQEARWDHDRDYRKHDFPPLHAQSAPLSTAMDIVLIVRGMSNLQAAANLVDSYADLKAAGARLDKQQQISNQILERFEVPNV